MSTDAVIDPHDKMRSRDVNKVARGEQAPRPPADHPIVSKAPPPTSTDPKPKKAGEKDDVEDLGAAPADDAPRFTNQLRNCCIRYYEFYRCIMENEEDTSKCDKFAEYYRALCPYEWVEKWDVERELGIFPQPI
ncbi:cytochrome c oxidase subunit 6b-3-like [Coffea eugenioides]|uniref:cytochrome c oxidase subunit 6b-3-like n=1 Tax=Coffea eugenioides TaxID=49369 RepID=UPI000F6119C0|nr:cytochrome c oxidase subunit 6b-3-like [Coffea eugenioides]